MVIPFAVGTGVVVIAVAVAVVLVVLFVTASMRGRQKRGAQRRSETQRELDDAQQRVARAEHERDVAQQGKRGRRPGGVGAGMGPPGRGGGRHAAR